jgi:hypothetical protein
VSFGTDPTLLAQMAASRPTRLVVGVLLLSVVVCAIVGAWFVGRVHATEQRFAMIESAVKDASVDSREIYTRLTVIETRLVGLDETMERMRIDVAAIRNAVAPLPSPRSK